jgi:hypothetical protein
MWYEFVVTEYTWRVDFRRMGERGRFECKTGNW